MNTVETTLHLVIGQKFKPSGHPSGKPSVRVAMRTPYLAPHEVAIRVTLQLPESLFKRPALSATVVVNGSQAQTVITPSVANNIAQVIADQLGIVMEVRAPKAGYSNGR